MTKQYFIELAEFNIWANDLVHSWLDKISDDQWNQPIISSFKSLAETTVHTAGAEKIWLERLNKVENSVFLTSEFKGTKQDALAIWKKTSMELKSFVEGFDEANYKVILGFKRLNGQYLELEYYQIFAHVLNHSTYHRGQMVTMLRQTGFTELASTDLSTFYWNKKKS